MSLLIPNNPIIGVNENRQKPNTKYQFPEGSLVSLKSGSPKMIVAENTHAIHPKTQEPLGKLLVVCIYYNDVSGSIEVRQFPEYVLELYEEKKEKI